ncbi:hypothetical protein D3C77_586900 [compost metagenome]
MPALIGHVVLMEDIAHGERVRQYVLEAYADGAWKEIVHGIAIGHKKIDVVTPMFAEKIRLQITEAVANPIIRKFAIYGVQK